MAITIGSTIYLYKSNINQLLENKKWLCHELTHVKQFEKYGRLKFIFLYLIETTKNGYYNNKFEIEARANENNKAILNEFEIVPKNKLIEK